MPPTDDDRDDALTGRARAEPILPSRDLAETRAFYEKLGFAAWWGDRGPWD